MQSIHVLRFALHGSLLPLHLEQRQAARSAHRNKRVSQCEASTFPRHRTRCARRCLLQLRCCTPLQLCNTLFQRLALLSDTSLVQSAFGRAFSLRSPLRARDILSSPSFPLSGALALFAYGSVDYSRCAVRRGTNSIAPMTAAATLLSSFVRAVLTWRHRTVTSPCGRRHFYGGIATNCLNNSKSAPLSPSSSPLRTALSSPPIAVSNLAKGKRAVLPWSPNSASRFWLSRQRFDRTSLAYSARRARAKSEKRLRAVGGLYRR